MMTQGAKCAPLGRFPYCRQADPFLPVSFRAILRQMKRPGLYANINARRKAGTSRPKSQSTISPRTWRLMKAKKGGFSEKRGSR